VIWDVPYAGGRRPAVARRSEVGLGTSLLIAAGARLRFAVRFSTHGFSVPTAGVILMAVGIIGLVISAFWVTLWSNRGVEPLSC